MASATYEVKIDFGRDGTYGHAQSDLTAYVLDMTWNNGMTRPDLEVANPASLSLTLSNTGGDFNVEDSGATFYGLFARGQLVRVRATFSAVTYTLFTGKLRTVPYIDPKTYGSQQVTIIADDLMEQMLDAEFVPDLLTSITADQALQHVFDKAAAVLPYASDYWMLGHSASALGTNTTLVDTGVGVNFETGKTTLAYVGDNTGGDRSTRVQQYIRDALAAEGGGRFYFDGRTGKFVFHNRHHDINPASAATLTAADYDDGRYVAQTEVTNHVTVHYTPREIGGAASVLWQSEGVITLAGGEVKTIKARYRDASDNSARVGGKDFIVPLKGTDMVANLASDGSGEDRTNRTTLSVEFGAGEAQIVLENSHHNTFYVTTMQVRGTPIKSFQRQSVELSDPDSIYNYDQRDETITLNAVDTLDLAQSIAGVRLAQFKKPHSWYENISFNANKVDSRMTQALTRDIGDTITVTHTGINHSKMYVIVGERHRVQGGGDHSHEVTWILKSNDRGQFWVLSNASLSLLSDTTILSF